MGAATMRAERMLPGPADGLDRIFHARSVVLVGLSSDPRKMTGAPLGILQQTGFAGRIYVVNPKHREIGGIAAYPSIAALPESPDVAMIMLPARLCAGAVRQCAEKGIPAAVIPSSGFEESEDGADAASELAEAARETGVAVVGPNCEGIWSVASRVLLTFGSAAKRDVLHHAPVAILSQSGAMAGAVARHLQNDAMGCAYVVSVGNETVLTIADYLQWMIRQEDVRVVLLFIEGARDGQRLLDLIADATSRGIRVVALKSGNSEAGLKAAASHTGKMASPYAIYRDLLRQAGAIQVDSLTDLIAAGEVLATTPVPAARGAGAGVSVFSVPGGTRAMTADQCEIHDVPLATFGRKTVAALSAALPEFGGVENPTDLTGQVLSYPGLFDECLRIIAADPSTEALLVQVANRGPNDVMERIDLLGDVAKQGRFPVVASFLGDALPASQRVRLRAAGVVCARDPAEATRFLGWLYQARRAADRPATAQVRTLPAPGATPLPLGWANIEEYLRSAGIGSPGSRVLPPGKDTAEACAGLSFPVAVKATPDDADHKTESGLVALNVADEVQVAAHAARIRQILGRAQANVLVQEMVVGGVEVLLSAVRNPDFGPVMAIGSGGIAVELHNDVTWLALPASASAVRAALSRTRLGTLLAGFRGAPPADVDALVGAAVRLGELFLATTPAPAEIEINPLLVLPAGRGVVAVDAIVKP